MGTNTLGQNLVFPILNSDGTSFHGLVLRKATYDSVVMSLGDKVTGDVYYKDNTLEVTMSEYIEYKHNPNDENEVPTRFVLVNPPTIVREGMAADNSALKGMTKYSFVFYHPMYVLNNFPFSDVAVSTNENKYLSENKSFSWIGYPDDFIEKLNKNLEGTEWIVLKSSRFPQDKDNQLSDIVSFNNNTVAEAIKRGYEIWGLPYVITPIKNGEEHYSEGKRFKVEYGFPSNKIIVNNSEFVFRFGKGVGLKNNSRTPRNNKIITRISGFGSEENIPYGYPQIQWYGDSRWDYTEYDGSTINYNSEGKVTNNPKSSAYPIYKGIVGGAYVKLIKHPFTRTTLMPSIFNQTVFNKVSPYLPNGNANTNYDPTIELKDYYDAVATQQYPYINEINLSSPSYESHEFSDIKPELNNGQPETIVGVTPLNSDLTPASNWDDTMDDDGNYLQRYFKLTLPQLDFDLYACAAITEEMQINMRSGACIGCTFPVQVDWEDYKKNFYDDNGNFAPQGQQRDLTKYPRSDQGSINIIVQKENSTFGKLMPNTYQYPVVGDEFVILGISLPLSYITNAEQRLDAAMKTYMLENNIYYYDYPLKFDEYFLATHTNILEQIRTNTVIKFTFGNETNPLELFVKQITIKYGDGALPKYDITLTDNVEIVLNQIGSVAADVEKLSALISAIRQNYGRNVWYELSKKLSKTEDDTARGNITFQKGLYIGNNFVSGLFGNGGVFNVGADGKTYLEADKLYVRMKAYFDTVEIRKYLHSSGNRIASSAGVKCVRVEYINANGDVVDNAQNAVLFRCYFRGDDGDNKVTNDFVIGDQAYCHITNLSSTDALYQHHFWRMVIGRNTEGELTDNGEYYIDLSNRVTETIDIDGNTITHSGYESGSDIPVPQDDIIQLGNVNDITRQGAIIEYVNGNDAPSYQIFQGINDFSFENKNYLMIGYNSQTGRAYMKVYGDFYVGSRNENTYVRYNAGNGKLEIKGEISASSTIDGNSIEDYIHDVTEDDFNALGTERNNMLRNTSFTGDYDSETYSSNSEMSENTQVYSDGFDYWEHNGAVIVDYNDSASLCAVEMNSGQLQQTIDYPLVLDKYYMFSLRAIAINEGDTLTVNVAGEVLNIELTNTLERYDFKLLCSNISDKFTISGSGRFMELMLTMGTIRIGWSPNHLDNDRAMVYYQQLDYLTNAIVNSSTQIIGGLVLSQIIKVGNFRNRVMTQETGGMSGAYTNEYAPFLWGGGTLEQAIYTIAKYRNNPQHQPTQNEIANMAKFVVSHGGRAILNDIILRGYVYADGGVFRGAVYATSGEFKGRIECSEGWFGQLVIKGNYIENRSDDAAIYFQSQDTYQIVNIGTNVAPTTSNAKRLITLTNNEQNDLSLHQGIYIDVSGSVVGNSAIVAQKGVYRGFRMAVKPASNTLTPTITDNNIVCTNDVTITLPDECEVGHEYYVYSRGHDVIINLASNGYIEQTNKVVVGWEDSLSQVSLPFKDSETTSRYYTCKLLKVSVNNIWVCSYLM